MLPFSYSANLQGWQPELGGGARKAHDAKAQAAAVDAPLHRRSAVGAALHEDALQMLVANLR